MGSATIGTPPEAVTLGSSVLVPEIRIAPTTWQRIRRSFRTSLPAMLSLIFLVALTLLCLLAPWIARYDPLSTDLMQFEVSPNRSHWLGTDSSGFDIWSRLLWGGRTSLLVAVSAVAISITIGTIVGAISGYFRGWIDSVLMRITDGFIAFPDIVLILMLASVLGASVRNVVIVIGALGWTGTARLVRGQFLMLREQDWVLAANSIGVSNGRLIVKHLLPHVLTQIVVIAAFGAASAILTEAGLSYLGLGVRPPSPSWGSMLANAQSVHILQDVPWSWVVPGATLTMVVIAISYVGDTLRRALDPRGTFGTRR